MTPNHTHHRAIEARKEQKKVKGWRCLEGGGYANHHDVRERSPSELLDAVFFVVFFVKGVGC